MQNFNTFDDRHSFRVIQINIHHYVRSTMLHGSEILSDHSQKAQMYSPRITWVLKTRSSQDKKAKWILNVSYLLCLVNKADIII